MPATIKEAWGSEAETVVVTESGRIWLVQSVDTDRLPRELEAIPAGLEQLSFEVCLDLDLEGISD